MRRVQHRVLGEVHQDREAMALAAAEHDQIRAFLSGDAQNLGLGVAGLDPAGRALETGGAD